MPLSSDRIGELVDTVRTSHQRSPANNRLSTPSVHSTELDCIDETTTSPYDCVKSLLATSKAWPTQHRSRLPHSTKRPRSQETQEIRQCETSLSQPGQILTYQIQGVEAQERQVAHQSEQSLQEPSAPPLRKLSHPRQPRSHLKHQEETTPSGDPKAWPILPEERIHEVEREESWDNRTCPEFGNSPMMKIRNHKVYMGSDLQQAPVAVNRVPLEHGMPSGERCPSLLGCGSSIVNYPEYIASTKTGETAGGTESLVTSPKYIPPSLRLQFPSHRGHHAQTRTQSEYPLASLESPSKHPDPPPQFPLGHKSRHCPQMGNYTQLSAAIPGSYTSLNPPASRPNLKVLPPQLQLQEPLLSQSATFRKANAPSIQQLQLDPVVNPCMLGASHQQDTAAPVASSSHHPASKSHMSGPSTGSIAPASTTASDSTLPQNGAFKVNTILSSSPQYLAQPHQRAPSSAGLILEITPRCDHFSTPPSDRLQTPLNVPRGVLHESAESGAWTPWATWMPDSESRLPPSQDQVQHVSNLVERQVRTPSMLEKTATPHHQIQLQTTSKIQPAPGEIMLQTSKVDQTNKQVHQKKREEISNLPRFQIVAEVTAYPEDKADSGAELSSPCSDTASPAESDTADYETPNTSPGSSPPKRCAKLWMQKARCEKIAQFDGSGSDGTNNTPEDTTLRNRATTPTIGQTTTEDGLCSEHQQSGLADPESYHGMAKEHNASPERHECPNLTLSVERVTFNLADKLNLDETTTLAPASPAKAGSAFPFLVQNSGDIPLNGPSRLRYPSALLRHCERNATPRQRRLMGASIRSPDRFIPSRTATPTKEALFLPKPAQSMTLSGNRDVSRSMLEDPFGPAPRRSLRMAEQYATIRQPPSVPRSVGLIASRVENADSANPRAASVGTVWTVGGTIVTEGVASVTNGRGGRVTSGSSAPHYTADFLRKNSSSEEEFTHGRRLAVAMEIGGAKRMIGQVNPTSPRKDGISERVWRDGIWDRDGSPTASKSGTKKGKNIPVIPFRVLDAPALRDDYYCSLLAYSQSVECLAVGLGPHVYLWSEPKGKTTIPDSFTAPLGTAHVTSVSFSSYEGGSSILAIGRADGRITLWSPLDRNPRFDSEQPNAVSYVCFRPSTVRRQSLRDAIATVATEELLVGDEIGCVYYYSIEWPSEDQRDLFNWHGSMTLLARFTCHSQQICGIAWSPDGNFFATGGNDNQLFLFESRKVLQTSARLPTDPPSHVHVRRGSTGSSTATVAGQGEVLSMMPGTEKHIFNLNAAVKAIAFSPWQSTLLAAGGGSNDRCIHFFHTLSGAALATIDCHAQVTSLVWSARRKEIAATFGFAQPEHPYRVAVFSWPSCSMVVGIPWFGEERALFAVPYPRGPSTGHQHRGTRYNPDSALTRKGDTEGQPWYGRRTGEEGCLVIATSDASIKFHEIWAERHAGEKKRAPNSALGSSQILEGECSPEIESFGAIR